MMCTRVENLSSAQQYSLLKKAISKQKDNYRPIKLLSELKSLFTRMIAHRITNKLDSFRLG